MSALNLRTTFERMKSHLQASGRFPGGVTVGKPAGMPADIACAIEIERFGPPEDAQTTLSNLQGELTMKFSLYANEQLDPREEVEFRLLDAMGEILEDFFGDFDLDGLIRNWNPAGVSMEAGFGDFGHGQVRVFALSIPMVINDVAAFSVGV